MFNRSKRALLNLQPLMAHVKPLFFQPSTTLCFTALSKSKETHQVKSFSAKKMEAYQPLHPLESTEINHNKIKNRLMNLIHGLLTTQSASINTAELRTLKRQIANAATENDVKNCLYSCETLNVVNLKSWKEVKHHLIHHRLFREPLKHKEQCYLIMNDPEQLGIRFEHDAKLINRYTNYLHFLYRHQCSFGEETPSLEECYQDTLNELTDALREGKYQSVRHQMVKQCDGLSQKAGF